MRSFNFKVKLIGEEKYLTYIMGEETQLDEDILDYCEENDLKELVKIIYEEDDDYDYLTYDVTGCRTVDELLAKEMKCENVLMILRNIANSLISLKEQAIKLNYILLNRQFMYVDDVFNVKFICLPVESSGGLATEFKGFVRQFLANIRYDVDEDLNYVGKLLTYINGDSFNLRGLVGLSEALMEEAGISFDEVEGIEADGVEVMNTEDVEPEGDTIKNFMESLAEESDEPLPEIGDDEEDAEEEEETSDDDELESILPAGMKFESTDEAVEPVENVTEAGEDEPKSDDATADTEEKVTDAKVSEKTDKEAEAEKTEVKAEEEVKATVANEQQPAEELSEAQINEETKTEEPTDEKETAVAEDTGSTDNLKKVEGAPKKVVKETDQEVLKSRIKALAENKTELKKKDEVFHNEQEMDAFLGSKPPVIKKNSVKVNRAAIIQNIAASEEEAELASKEKEEQVPVIEEISENINQEKKPKSNSILSKTVEPSKKQSVNVVNIAKAMPYLIRVNTKERIMLRKEVFKIGKASIGVDYTVSGNGAISRQHAVIIRRDDVSYIKDNKSTNHTYVNDKLVEEGEEVILTHDSLIRLGDEEFMFKIR